jgi:hypothetical protein
VAVLAVILMAGCGGYPSAASVTTSTTATTRVMASTPTAMVTTVPIVATTAVPVKNLTGTPGQFSALMASDAFLGAMESCAAADARDGSWAATLAFKALDEFGDRFPGHDNDGTVEEWLQVFITEAEDICPGRAHLFLDADPPR